MSFLDIILAVLVIAVLLVSKPLPKKENVFSRDSTASLRGVAMLGIMLLHIHSALGLLSPVLLQVGYLATGLFFFISGYGNTISLNKKKPGFKWLWSKFVKIYTPFLAAFWLCFVCNIWLNPEKNLTGTDTVIDLLTVSLPNQASWFPKIFLLCFLLHWLSVKLFSNTKLQAAAVAAALCVYVSVMWKLGFANCWYNSVLCYALGIAVSELRTIVPLWYDKFQRRKYLYIFILLTIFTVLTVGAHYKGIVQPACAFAFSLLCYVYTMAFCVKTRFLAWIGNNSFEFYLFHVVCVQVLCKLTEVNQYLYAVSVISASVLVVYLYLQGKRLIIKAH